MLKSHRDTCPNCDSANVRWEYIPDDHDGDVYGECNNPGCYADLVSGRFGIEVLSHE